MKKYRFQKQKGFSLIEVIVSAAIITIILSAAVYAVVKSVQMAHVARDKAIASNLARLKMEDIRKARDQAAALRKNWNSFTYPSGDQPLPPIQGVVFTVHWTVPATGPTAWADTAYNPNFTTTATPGYIQVDERTDFRLVTVWVTWTDYKRSYDTTIKTFLTSWQINPI